MWAVRDVGVDRRGGGHAAGIPAESHPADDPAADAGPDDLVRRAASTAGGGAPQRPFDPARVLSDVPHDARAHSRAARRRAPRRYCRPAKTVRVKLSAATRTALADARRVTFTVTVSAPGAQTVTRNITLKR